MVVFMCVNGCGEKKQINYTIMNKKKQLSFTFQKMLGG